MNDGPFNFNIGRGAWADEIRYFTAELHPDYWSDFRPLTVEEIRMIERGTGRHFPPDFHDFLRVFGCGRFPHPFGGAIYQPEDMVAACHGHLWMILGSGDWATEEEQHRYYVTRGTFNPAPDKYTAQAMKLEDLNLLDLLQIGIDGMSSYHQVSVSETPQSVGYCLLTPEGTIEDRACSFSEGLKCILTHHWHWNDPPEEDESFGGTSL